MLNLRLSFFEVFNSNFRIIKSSESVVSENIHVLPENIVLMYSQIFLNSNSSFQENVKTKVYALEDSLGVYRCGYLKWYMLPLLQFIILIALNFTGAYLMV